MRVDALLQKQLQLSPMRHYQPFSSLSSVIPLGMKPFEAWASTWVSSLIGCP